MASCRKSTPRRSQGARLVLSFVADFGSPWEKNISRLAPDAEVHHLDPRPTREGISAVDFLLEQLEDEPVVHQATSAWWPASARPACCRGRTTPGADRGSSRQRIGAEELADPEVGGVDEAGGPPGAPAAGRGGDGKDAREADGPSESAASEVRRPANLLELLDGLSGASAYVGHDSGPTHLAAIIGLPTLALFGPTDPAVWSPLGPRVRTLRREPLAELDPGVVSEALAGFDNP